MILGDGCGFQRLPSRHVCTPYPIEPSHALLARSSDAGDKT